MQIGIDCIALPPKFSGAANYIINLTKNLLNADRTFKLQIYCKTLHSHLFKNYLKPGDSIIEIKIKNRLQQVFYYEQFLSGMLIKNKTEVFLATHYITPVQNPDYKIISIFHDMGFILFPQHYPLLKRKYFQYRIPVFLERSEKIVTVSKNTLNDLVHIFPQVQSKILCIYPGTNHLHNYKIESVNGQTNGNPFILAVNSFEKRKNIPFILEIFNTLKSRYKIQHNLVVVGHGNNRIKQLSRTYNGSTYKDSVILLKDLSFGELKCLYNKADFFINASGYEGFGFTPIEAVAEGCPSFLYPNKVCRELFGEHPYLINSLQAEEWAKRIYSEMGNKFSKKISYENLTDLTWEKCTANFVKLFEKI